MTRITNGTTIWAYNRDMTVNELHWIVKPCIPSHWHETLQHDGFDVQIGTDFIELRKNNEGDCDTQQSRANQIVDGIVRKIGLEEKKRFTARLDGVARFDPETNRRDATALLCGAGVVAMSGHVDVLVTSADGTVVADSRKDRMAGLLKFAGTSATSDTLGRMSDYLLEYYGEREKKLAALFDIIELAAEAFGHEHKAATSLGIGVRRMKDATNVMNDASIRSGRHRGQELGPQRDPTPNEVQLCEQVAEQIITEYAKMVERGTAPK